jgi:hypothetical protein
MNNQTFNNLNKKYYKYKNKYLNIKVQTSGKPFIATSNDMIITSKAVTETAINAATAASDVVTALSDVVTVLSDAENIKKVDKAIDVFTVAKDAFYGAAREFSINEFGFLYTFGEKGTLNGQFMLPNYIELDHEDNLVVVDSYNHRIQIINYNNGKWIRTIGSNGSSNGEFQYPSSVAFIDQRYIAVADGDHRIQILDYISGNHIRTIGSYGDKDGEFIFPCCVIVDPYSKNILVRDGDDNPRIQEFSNAGKYIRTICCNKLRDDEDKLKGAGKIAFDKDRNIVVADSGNNQLQVISYVNGRCLRKIGRKGNSNCEFNNPRDFAFDIEGNIVIAELWNFRMQILNYTDGSHIQTFGMRGNKNGEFNKLRSVVVDKNGLIIVCDGQNNRIQVFKPDYTFNKTKSNYTNILTFN